MITAESELREKNQITLPKRVADALGVHAGDRLIFVVDEDDPDVVHVHRLPDSYAGALAGVYGSPEEVRAYLQAEREAWNQ
jgi:AbrB family looped-hinge helix DNA binding protein